MEKNTQLYNFIAIIKDEDHEKASQSFTRFCSIVNLVREYPIGTENRKYWVMQISSDYVVRQEREILRILYTYFPLVTIRQEDSGYILSTDGEELRKLLSFYREKGIEYFVYDHLSITERFYTCTEVDPSITALSDTRLMYYNNGAVYSLCLNKDCMFLFTDNPEITVLDEELGQQEELDLTEGLGDFKFHVAILD